MLVSMNNARRFSWFAWLFLGVAFASAPACGRPPAQVGGAAAQTVLLTNLHADGRGVIWSANYTNPPGGSTVPICTPVRIDAMNRREIRFTTLTDHRRYRFVLHRSARSTIQEQMQRYFGPACPDIASLSPEDQAGIQNGQVYQGMTKQGVILALGYPPENITPSLEADVWRYYSNRFNRFEVYFTNGVVSGIRN